MIVAQGISADLLVHHLFHACMHTCLTSAGSRPWENKGQQAMWGGEAEA